MEYEIATFAAGCFWGVEAKFRKLDGVIDTMVGYTGGHVEDPNYRQVCTDTTGHAEAVQIQFDPQKITYQQLVEAFYQVHNPTTPNRQGPDFGSQYRSAIFYHTDAQKEIAETVTAFVDSSGEFKHPVVTEIKPASIFYKAEEYHQRYYEKHGLFHC